MRSWLAAIVGAIVVLGIAAAGLLYVYWDQFVPIAALGINYVRYMSARPGRSPPKRTPPVGGRRRSGRAGGGRRRGGQPLAKLQQDADLGPLLAARPDQQAMSAG